MSKKISTKLLNTIRNIGWLTGEKFLRMGINFIVVIYVVQYLGSENFGKLSYAISFVGLFEAIARLGLDNIVIRNLVKNEGDRNTILGTAFILKLVGSFVTVLLIIGTTLIIDPDRQVEIIIISFGLLLTAFDVINYWFKSQVHLKEVAVVNTIQFLIISACKIILVLRAFPLIAFVWLVLVDYFIKAIALLIIYLRKNLSPLKWQFNLYLGKNLIKDSWSLILSSVMVSIYMKIDRVMLGNMTNSSIVGTYAAAVKFSEIWYFVPVAICTAIFPSIIKAKEKDSKDYYKKLQQLYDFMVVISLSIAIITMLISQPLIINLLGTEYSDSATILTWHIWAGIFVFLGVARTQWLIAENYTIFSFATTGIGAITNVLLNLYLIPNYQGIGAAIATVISYAVAGYFACFFYYPMFKTGKMLTLALCLPFRWRQNLIYLRQLQKIF